MSEISLKNGASVIDFHPDTNVVLAKYNGEFVTWVVDEDMNCHWGHYFNSIFTAVADYEERTRHG